MQESPKEFSISDSEKSLVNLVTFSLWTLGFRLSVVAFFGHFQRPAMRCNCVHLLKVYRTMTSTTAQAIKALWWYEIQSWCSSSGLCRKWEILMHVLLRSWRSLCTKCSCRGIQPSGDFATRTTRATMTMCLWIRFCFQVSTTKTTTGRSNQLSWGGKTHPW